MTMTVRVTCEKCGQQSTAAEKLRGKTLACPNCGASLVVPMVSADDLLPRSKRSEQNEEDNQTEPPIEAEKHEHAEAKSGGHSSHGPDFFGQSKKMSNPSDLIDMTAMVDIVFFLLIYFLVTSFVQLIAAIQAPSTTSQVGRQLKKDADAQEGMALTVRIDQDNVVWIEQEAVFGPPEVYARLKSTREEVGAERLRISASAEATHGKMVMVLDAGMAAGFKSAQLSIEETAVN
jgi:biopolymer transport protein ExbD